MIDRKRLLDDLKPLLRAVEEDLRARCDEAPEIDQALQAEYTEARSAGRTGEAYEQWRADLITQVGVAWVLSCVFVRFLEDNGLLASPRIAGRLKDHPAGGGLERARDERDLYFQAHPTDSDRDYLLHVFAQLAAMPATAELFGPHNPLNEHPDWLSGDAAQKLIEFFQRIDADGTGEIIHDFTSGQWSAVSGQQDGLADSRSLNAESSEDDTRFLGDLYQDLSEAARKKYALLQTPVFVEEFILERTLEPAIQEFGLDGKGGQRSALSDQQDEDGKSSLKADTLNAESSKASGFRMIDPACGSGHFLLGAFARILDHWRRAEPGAGERELINRALASVHGVDINPYAVAIARFRLLLAAMRECGVTRLKDAPNFQLNLACGDSLLHGSANGQQQVLGFHELAHHYQSEDIEALRRILKPEKYHAVVANPPYIGPSDKAANQAYRQRYRSCYRQYSLSVPFTERLFSLASWDGFVGQITSNSFTKREFGGKLIEEFIPTVDLTHVVDTSGARIPGHGTPTLIMFGRHRAPVSPRVRCVMGIEGESAEAEHSGVGHVWKAIVSQIDSPGSESRWVSVADRRREALSEFPWVMAGGGATRLKEEIEENSVATIADVASDIGAMALTRDDDAYIIGRKTCLRSGLEAARVRDLVAGQDVRDYQTDSTDAVIWPCDSEGIAISSEPLERVLWPFRPQLCLRPAFGKTQLERGLRWTEYSMLFRDRYLAESRIAFADVCTHNHFAVPPAGVVCTSHAPVIALPANDRERVLGLLNSSTACFWFKQVLSGKHMGDGGVAHASREGQRFEFDTAKVKRFPLCSSRPGGKLDELIICASNRAATAPAAVLSHQGTSAAVDGLKRAWRRSESLLQRMCALQEELDWECYELYGLLDDAPCCDDPPSIQLGQRAFEIVLARKMEAGEEETTWFARHNSTPMTEIPAEWPEEYKQVVQRRIELIESDRNIGLIERPEYKRRWNVEPWEQQQERALRNWLLDRLESYFDLDGRMNASTGSAQAPSAGSGQVPEVTAHASLREPRLTSIALVADIARSDSDFMQVSELYRGRADFDIGALVAELIEAESVPHLPILRYKPSGLDKRAAWERTWELQRLEDDIDALFDVKKLSALSSQQSATGDQLTAACRKAVAESLPLNAEGSEAVLSELVSAAKLLANMVAQKLNLESEDVIKPITDAAKRAKAKAVGDIPVPPKYASKDFLTSDFWRLRGKLDVPKERWVSFPHCEGEDGSGVIAWAGYDHLQLAQSIAERFENARQHEGRTLVPLLASLGQLIPWLKQWHNEMDPTYGLRLGDYFEGHLETEAKALNMTPADVMAWQPPASAKKTRKRRKKTKKSKGDA